MFFKLLKHGSFVCYNIAISVSTEDWVTFPLGTLKSADVQVLYKDSISLVYNLGPSLYRPYFVPLFFFEISVLPWSHLQFLNALKKKDILYH